MKASYSSENVMLPVSDPPNSEDRERLLKGDNKTFGRRRIYAAISYMSCAVLLVLFNKAALSSYHFPSASVVTLLQMVCSCCFLYVLRRWGIISFTAGESVIKADNSKKFVPVKTFKHTLPLAGAYLLYMLVTMESVRGVNVPMYTTLRRTTVVFTMFMEYMLVGQRYTPPVISSVSLIVFGAFIAGARDFSFDAYGYAIVFLSNITTAIYLATIACVGCIRKTSGLNSFGLMWCNGVICFPFLLIWTLAWGDLKMTLHFSYLLSPGFQVVLLFSCLLAFFLNYSIFLNTTLNSALTQTICGNLKLEKALVVILGFMSFAILLAEATILTSGVDLSVFSILVHAAGQQEGLVQTFNEFFVRELKPGSRPIASAERDDIAVCAADCRLTAFKSVDDSTRFWIKDLCTIGFGWIIFGGLPFDVWNVVGQCLGFVGSGLYAYYKLIGK